MKRSTRIGVYGVAIEKGSILLVKKNSKGFYAGLYDLPGGGIEFGENADDTLRREYREEVGMEFDTMHLFDNISILCTAYSSNHEFHHIGQIYIVKNCRTIPHAVPEEEFDWHKIEKIDLYSLTPFAKQIVALAK